jgi:hypothetical protein
MERDVERNQQERLSDRSIAEPRKILEIRVLNV